MFNISKFRLPLIKERTGPVIKKLGFERFEIMKQGVSPMKIELFAVRR